MGASGWQARVPFGDGDVGAALQQARQRAYDDGAFYRETPNDKARSMGEAEYVAWGMAQTFGVDADDPALAGNRESFHVQWRAARVVVTGPDTLLTSQPDSGTHSIIDMTHVADEPGYFAVAPLRPDQLQTLFGTTQATVAQIESTIDQIFESMTHYRDRWQGMYLVAYREGQPHEIFFVGFSGD